MIESRYWREELDRIAKTLKRVRKPPRWSERACCVVERDLMIGFFIVRKLIEANKVSSQTRDFKMEVYSSPAKNDKITLLNNHRISENYDLENEKSEAIKPKDIANQFVHAYTSFVFRDDTRNWSDVYVVSDRDKKKCIRRIPISSIRDFFICASNDYVSIMLLIPDKKMKKGGKGDFTVITD